MTLVEQVVSVPCEGEDLAGVLALPQHPGEVGVVIVVGGPTAAGKTAVAIELALRFGGEIVNADSMQVYRELAVLTARPSAADMSRAPHLLYGTSSAAEAYSVGSWLDHAARAIAEASDAGRVPILVGGTGLYFKALTEGLAAIPDMPPDIREHWRERAEAQGPEQLHRELAARDPAMAARLRPTDPQRIARALAQLDVLGGGDHGVDLEDVVVGRRDDAADVSPAQPFVGEGHPALDASDHLVAKALVDQGAVCPHGLEFLPRHADRVVAAVGDSFLHRPDLALGGQDVVLLLEIELPARPRRDDGNHRLARHVPAHDQDIGAVVTAGVDELAPADL